MIPSLAWVKGPLEDYGISERIVASTLTTACAQGLPGLVEVSLSDIGREAQRQGEKLEWLFGNLSTAGIAHIDQRGYAWVPKIWYSSEFWCPSPNHLRAWYRAWKAFPECGLRYAWLVTLRRLLPQLRESKPIRKAFRETFEPHLVAYLEWAGVPADELRHFVRPPESPPLGKLALGARRKREHAARRQGVLTDREYSHREEQLRFRFSTFRDGDLPRSALVDVPVLLPPRLLPVGSWKDSTEKDLVLRSQNQICLSLSSDQGGLGGSKPGNTLVTPSEKHTETIFQEVEESGVFRKDRLGNALVTPSIVPTKHTYGDFGAEKTRSPAKERLNVGSKPERNTKQSEIEEQYHSVEEQAEVVGIQATGSTKVTPSWKQSETKKSDSEKEGGFDHLLDSARKILAGNALVTPSDPAGIRGVAKHETNRDFSIIPGRSDYQPPSVYTDPEHPGSVSRDADIEKVLGNKRFMDRLTWDRPRMPQNQPGMAATWPSSHVPLIEPRKGLYGPPLPSPPSPLDREAHAAALERDRVNYQRYVDGVRGVSRPTGGSAAQQRINDARARGAGLEELVAILDAAVAEAGAGGDPKGDPVR